jgi:hypothetical protein
MTALTAPERLERAAQARRDGRYAEALEHHLWFHENAPAEAPELRGVRLSFALSDWGEPGALYPPARAALVAARDVARDRVLSGAGDREAFADVEAINEELGEEHLTHELFRRLDAEYPELARRCGRIAFPLLAARGDHEPARRCLDDPEAFVRRHAGLFATSPGVEPPERAGARARTHHDHAVRHYAERIAQLLGVLVAVGEHDADRNARDLALAGVADADVRDEVAARLTGGRRPATPPRRSRRGGSPAT